MSEKFKGFNVKDECVAGAIKFMTGISYYKYNNDGIEVYTFPRNKIVFDAYKVLNDFVNNRLKNKKNNY